MSGYAMTKQRGLPGLLMIMSMLSGCAIVSSNPVRPDATEAANGVYYMLPKALLPIRAVASDGRLRVDVLEAVLVGDPRHAYLLNHAASPFSSDNVKVTLNQQTGLLTSVVLSAKDESGEILKKLAAIGRGARMEAAEVPEGEIVLHHAMLDPADDKAVERLNRDILAAFTVHARQRLSTCEAANDPAKAVTACAEHNAVLRVLGAQAGSPSGAEARTDGAATADSGARIIEPIVAICRPGSNGRDAICSPSGQEPADTPATRRAASAAHCSEGICYRAVLPYSIRLRLGDIATEQVVYLPNGSPTLQLPLKRSAMVTTTHNIVLVDGLLQSIHTDKPSEGLALASLPLDIVKAVFGAVGELIQLKIDLSGQEKALADAKVAEIQSKAALQKALIEKENNAESATLTGPKGIIASISVGAPPASKLIPGKAENPSELKPGTPNPGTR